MRALSHYAWTEQGDKDFPTGGPTFAVMLLTALATVKALAGWYFHGPADARRTRDGLRWLLGLCVAASAPDGWSEDLGVKVVPHSLHDRMVQEFVGLVLGAQGPRRALLCLATGGSTPGSRQKRVSSPIATGGFLG